MLETGHPLLGLSSSVHLGLIDEEQLPQAAVSWDAAGWQALPEAEAEAAVPSPVRLRQIETGLLNLVEDPLEPLPTHGEAARPYASMRSSGRVYCVLQVLLCQQEDGLWARRRYGLGSEWKRCPFDITGHLQHSQAFEVAGGDWYVFLFNTGQVHEVLTFDASRNSWQLPVAPTRVNLKGHAGVAPQPWRPVTKPPPADSKPLKGWLLEATGEYLMFLSPVSRDGKQRGLTDAHTALHFLGSEGQVISHQIACSAYQLTVHRYGCYMLLVKDCNHQSHSIYSNGSLNDDFDEEASHVVAWLLSTLDVSVPPMPVLLPDATMGFDRDCSLWSLVMCKNTFLEDLSSSAPCDGFRLHLAQLQRINSLAEKGEGDEEAQESIEQEALFIRLWVSRQIDAGFNAVHFEHGFHGSRYVRHALALSALTQYQLTTSLCQSASLWSQDVCHILRVSPEHKLQVWQCATWNASSAIPAKAMDMSAQTHAVETVSALSAVDTHALPGWGRCSAPAQGPTSVLTGVPCYPAVRWGESTFDRPEDLWLHPVGRDAGQHAPLSVMYP